MVTTHNRVWAIRSGDYVEVRLSLCPPRVRISKLTKTTQGRRVVMKQTFFVGGRVIGYAKSAFFQRTVQRVVEDKLVEIKGLNAEALRNPKTRKEFLPI